MASKFWSLIKIFMLDVVKRFYILVVTFVVLIIIALILIGGLSIVSSRLKAVKPGTYVKISIPPDMTESPYMYVQDWQVEKSMSMFKVLSAIRAAGTDPAVKGLIFDMDSLSFSSQHYEEFERAVQDFKKSGKKIYAFGNSASQNSYRNALLADSIVMTPSQSASFNITGYYASYSYYKTLFDKVGVSYTVVNTGPYKTYGENYVRDSISDQLREQIQGVYESRLSDFVEDVSQKRGLEREFVQQMIDSGEIYLISPIEAKEKGLVDRLEHYQSFVESLSESKDKKPPVIGLEKYMTSKHVTKQLKKADSNKIALIYAEGGIYMNQINPSIINREPVIIPSVICSQIEKAVEDKSIKGIVIRINSPGGSALASEIIHDSIAAARKKKPVYVSMGQVAASGGYYISAPADKIFAGESTITGSIGVVAVIPSFEGLYGKIGINQESIKRGENASIFDFTKDIEENEKKALQSNVDKIYAEFKERVSNGRKIEYSEVEKIAGGRIWTGEQAAGIGLVDEMGGLDNAVESLAKSLGLETYSVQVAQSAKRPQKIAKIIKDKLVGVEGMDENELPQELEKVQEFLAEYEKIQAWSKKPLMLMPFEIKQ